MTEQGLDAAHMLFSCSSRLTMQHPQEQHQQPLGKALQLCMLLPVLLLRWALQAYRGSEQWHDAISRAVWAEKASSQCWQACLNLSQHQPAQKVQAQNSQIYWELLPCVAYEITQSAVQLLQGSMHAVVVHMKGSGSSPAANSSAARGTYSSAASNASTAMVAKSVEDTTLLATYLSAQVPFVTDILAGSSSRPNGMKGIMPSTGPACATTTGQSSTSAATDAPCGSSGNASVAAWTALLLGAVTALEQSMCLHTQWDAVPALLQPTTRSPEPLGPAWQGAFLMTSTATHAACKQTGLDENRGGL